MFGGRSDVPPLDDVAASTETWLGRPFLPVPPVKIPPRLGRLGTDRSARLARHFQKLPPTSAALDTLTWAALPRDRLGTAVL